MTAVITGSQNGTVGLINAGTAVASTSGTSIDFTGIPAGVKRITVMLYNVSTSGTSVPIVQLGYSGGIVSTGYASVAAGFAAGGSAAASYTTGIGLADGSAANYSYQGHLVLNNVSGNIWEAGGNFVRLASSTYSSCTAGSISLSGTLDRIRITTVNGTDTFDAGSINILYE
jgi:hypothetical protein